MKTFWFLFALLLALTLVQCTDNSVIPVQDEFITKGPGSGGNPGGGGHTTTVSNNLSVPTIMVKGSFTGILLGEQLISPTGGDPLNGYEVDPEAYYYVQGVHKWQCQAITAQNGLAYATAEWGDNLGGDAQLKVGKPIRVELGLFDDTGLQMQGFNVIKLEPSKLDRESAYGTLAIKNNEDIWEADPQNLTARVYDSDVTFSVKNVGTGDYVVPEGSNPTAEINATGKVVYGYNLRVSQDGEYEITFTIPNVDISGVDVGTFINDPVGPDTVSLIINVTAGGGGGGH